MGLLGTGTVDDLKARGPGLIKRRGASARDYPDREARSRGYGEFIKGCKGRSEIAAQEQRRPSF